VKLHANGGKGRTICVTNTGRKLCFVESMGDCSTSTEEDEMRERPSNCEEL